MTEQEETIKKLAIKATELQTIIEWIEIYNDKNNTVFPNEEQIKTIKQHAEQNYHNILKNI